MQIGIISFKVGSRIFKFKEPLRLKNKYVDGGVCLTHSEEPCLTACNKTFTKCEKIIRDELAVLWEEYVLAPDDELTADAIVLKNKLLGMAEEIKK